MRLINEKHFYVPSGKTDVSRHYPS